MPIEGRHANLGSTHNPLSAQLKEWKITPRTESAGSETKQVHINPATQSACVGAKISAHKEAKGRPGEPKQVHTSPTMQREGPGSRDKCAQTP